MKNALWILAGRDLPGEARSLCREAFPKAKPQVATFAGRYYYTSTGSRCGSMTFLESGSVSLDDPGYCKYGSRIECSSGKCRFTCLGYSESDSSTIAIVRRDGDDIRFDNSAAPDRLYRFLSECELQQGLIRQDRQAFDSATAADPLRDYTPDWRLDLLIEQELRRADSARAGARDTSKVR